MNGWVLLGAFVLGSLVTFCTLAWSAHRSEPKQTEQPEEEPEVIELDYGLGNAVTHKGKFFGTGHACQFDGKDSTVKVSIVWFYPDGSKAIQWMWFSVYEIELLVETTELLDPKRKG